MSFDTTFDFTSYIAQTEINLNALNGRLASLNTSLARLQNIQGYADVIAPQISSINLQITTTNNQLTECNETLSNISALTSLDETDKETLYNFFCLLTKDANAYAGLLINNYVAMLANSDIVSLIADEVNDAPTKTLVAGIIMSQYT